MIRIAQAGQDGSWRHRPADAFDFESDGCIATGTIRKLLGAAVSIAAPSLLTLPVAEADEAGFSGVASPVGHHSEVRYGHRRDTGHRRGQSRRYQTGRRFDRYRRAYRRDYVYRPYSHYAAHAPRYRYSRYALYRGNGIYLSPRGLTVYLGDDRFCN